MDRLTALAFVIGIMGGVATWAALTLGSPYVMIWVVFIAWACFFATGGTTDALVKSIAANIWGVICATIALIVAQTIGVTAVTAGICVGVSVLLLILGGRLPLLNAIPAAVLGYASTAALVLMGGSLGTDPATLATAAAAIAVSMVIGNILGMISGKIVGAISKRPLLPQSDRS